MTTVCIQLYLCTDKLPEAMILQLSFLVYDHWFYNCAIQHFPGNVIPELQTYASDASWS